MKRFLFLITLFYSLNFTAQEVYPLQPIERTSFYAEPLDEPTYTELPSGSITARESGANMIGLTTGELSVSGSGAAVYTVPIAVPKGIGGVAPTLALTYNSQSGNGIAGYGWHLAGLSVISRVGSTMYHNGKITEVNLTNTDQFALDGQRLILKEGTHGESGALYETETFSQLRIKAVGRSKNPAFGPDYFEVLYPDGSKAYYGKDNNSQSPMEYAISYWENAQGVSIRYFYTIENNHLHIEHIEYGYNAKIEFKYDNRTRPEVAYIGGMEFTNGKILSQINLIDNNLPYRNYKLSYNTNSLEYNRLTSVQEKIGEEERSPIEFKYWDTFNRRKRWRKNKILNTISTVETSLGKINTLNTATIPIDLNADNFTDFILYPTIKEKDRKELFFFDNFRQDTTKTIAHRADVSKFNDIFAVKMLTIGGNLYKAQGFVLATKEFKKVVLKVCRKEINSINVEYTKEWNLPTYWDERAYYQGILDNREASLSNPPKEKYIENPNYQLLSGDFNGDGLTELLGIEFAFPYEKCHIMKRECFCDVVEKGRGIYLIDLDRRKEKDYTYGVGYIGDLSRTDLLWSMDVNSNGKTDLVRVTKGGIYIYEMNENKELKLINEHRSPNIHIDEMHPIAGDFNGDGKIDFLLPTEDKSDKFEVLLNAGIRFLSIDQHFTFNFKKQNEEMIPIRGKFPILYQKVINNYSFIPIDFNNDGKTDIVQIHSVIAKNKYNIANGVENSRKIVVFTNIQKGREITFSEGDVKILEEGNTPHIIFSSPDEQDRVTDISLFSGNKIQTLSLRENNREDVLVRNVINGGVRQTITYKNMVTLPNLDKEKGTYYWVSTYPDELYPYTTLPNMQSVRLVSQLEREGIGVPKAIQRYVYYNATTHTQGLGFLGFKAIGQTNWFEPNKEHNQVLFSFKETNPLLRGALTNEYILDKQWFLPTYIIRNIPFQKTSYQYTQTLSSNKVFKLQLAQQTTEDKLSGLTTTNNFTYDSDGNLTEQRTQTDGYSQSTRISYLPKSEAPYFVGLPQKKETTTTLAGDSFSTAETFAYDKGLLTTHKTQGNGTGWRTTSYDYDEYGNITEQTATAENGEQRTKRYTYDPTHRLVTSHTDHEGQVTKFSYNNKGLLERKTSPLGQTTLYTYDLWGRPIQTTDFLGKKTTTHYEFNGSIFKTITENEEGTYSAESYNTLGWLLEKESNDAFNNRYAVSYEYNGIGQQVAVSTPHLARGASQKVKRTEYDVYGRPTTITNPEGKVTRFTYDKLKTTADDGQQQVISTRDAQGNIVEHQDNGGTVRYTYFANGNLKTADYSGAVQRITQDGWGRKISLTDPSAGRYTYQYDAWGNPIEQTTPKGKTTFSYEQGTDRLTEKHITGDYTDMRIRYTYNADKLLTQIDNQNKDRNNDSYRYEYNGLKQLVQTTETNPQAVFTKNYTYDAFGRVQQETTTAQTAGKRVSSAVQYRYENGDLVEMKTPSGATLWKLTASNEYGQPLSLHKGKTKELLDYNTHFPKTQIVQREDTPLNVLQYDFNPQRGLLNHRTYSFYNQKEEFAYDTTDRLTRWGNATHQYDERGRITENSAIGTYEYTRNGYQQQKLTTNEAGETYLEKYPLPVIRYNAFKAPEQIYVKDKERISYDYNAFGERSHCYYGNAEVEKAKRPLLKHYSHDGSTEIVCNKTDNSTKFILYLGGDAYSAPAILISNGEASKLYYLHRDYLGSIVMLTDEDGNIAERRHFDPWGQPIKIADGAGNTLDKLTLLDRGFTGHEHLQTVGLIHMNARLYDPALHRFLQPDNYVQDPFNTQNFNRYGYCLNNPLVYVDQNGEFWHLVIGAVVGGVINWISNGARFDAKGLGYFAVGAVAGAVGAGIGSGVSASLAGGTFAGGFMSTSVAVSSSFINGAAIGAASGLGAGFVGGFGNGLVGGQNIRQAFGSGITNGLIGMAMGGVIGGLSGGIDAAIDGRRFWDGATLLEERYLANQQLPLVKQQGQYNCAPATGESTTGISQTRYRTILHGDPNTTPIDVNSFNNAIKSETGRNVVRFTNYLPKDKIGAEQIAGMMNRGNHFYLISNSSQAGITHATALNSVFLKTYQRISGSLYYKVIYQAMDPAIGAYTTIKANSMKYIFKIQP